MIKKILKWAFILFILIALAAVVLWYLGRNERKVSADVTINATPAQVMAVLRDVDTWAGYNPMIVASHGQVNLGDTVALTMIARDGGDGGPHYEPEIIELSDLGYRWRAKIGGGVLFVNDKVFELTPINGGTKLTQTEVFRGMMLPLMWGMLDSGVGPIIDSMNQAFKAKAEG